MLKKLNKIPIDNHTLGLWTLMAMVLVLMAIVKGDTYFTIANFKSLVYQFPEYGILAFGMMACMISGGIDLSLVGIMNLSGVFAALIMTRMGGSPIAITFGCGVAILLGALCGAFNGALIGGLHIPAMLVTLCTLQLYQGLALAITGGPAINNLPKLFVRIANGSIGHVPYVIFIFIAVTFVVWFLMNCTVFGREIYFIGSNDRAARYSGIRTTRALVRTYLFSGVLGAIAGLLITSHLNSAKSSNGVSYTLLSLLIVVLGGINPDGGEGKVTGVVLSVVLLQMIANAFTILRQPDTMKTFFNGVILVLVLMADVLYQKHKSRVRREKAAEKSLQVSR